MGVLNIHSTNEQSHSVPRIQTQLINSNEKIEFADSNERSAFKRNYLKHIIISSGKILLERKIAKFAGHRKCHQLHLYKIITHMNYKYK